MSETEPYRIQVTAVAEYVAEQSHPQDNHYVFAYNVTILNAGGTTAQLLGRNWLITDGNGKVQEVHGQGVVGEQPMLAPGQAFRYTSGCVLSTPVGTMQGSYRMRSEDGHEFEAEIPAFVLAMPKALH